MGAGIERAGNGLEGEDEQRREREQQTDGDDEGLECAGARVLGPGVGGGVFEGVIVVAVVVAAVVAEASDVGVGGLLVMGEVVGVRGAGAAGA